VTWLTVKIRPKRVLWAVLSAIIVLAGIGIGSFAREASNVTVSPEQLIQFLNQSIALYHQTTIQQQIATEPQEQLLLYDNRQLATQSVQLAFDFARSQLDAMSAEPPAAAASAPAGASSQYNTLHQMLVTIDGQLQDTQKESDADSAELAHASGAKRTQLQSEISELQGEIALAQARRDAIQSLLQFASGSATNKLGTSDIRAEVEALASSVPAASSSSTNSSQEHAAEQPVTLSAGQPNPSGIWELGSDLFALSGKLRTVNSMIAETTALLQTSQALRQPFLAQLRVLSSQGNQLATQADTSTPAQLSQERQQLDALAAQFKQISTAVIPLSKQNVLLNLYQTNLASWRDDIYSRYKSDLRNLGIRLAGLALLLAVLIGLSELWRRAVYRYVREARRRYQFLLLRKLAFWFVIGLIVLITLAPKLGSFVTFAGLLTAGVAVALQNVLVAMVGYFFLIGKFGIRVGDRIEVNNVKGEVIDIGLVRFHVMELGVGATPTGRVVAFSNSVVFQASSGLFKQIPGASFAWHEVTLTVPSEADFDLVRKSLCGAVEHVLRDYHDDIGRSYGEMEKTGILISERGFRPKLELHLTTSGIEVTVRYPVDLQHAADIDARVSRALLNALARESKLQTAAGPSIRLKTDVPAGATD
jgi:small-conductance mechanosensitive channel